MADKKELIYGKMLTIMEEIGYIEKSQKNESQRYNYRGVDDVLNHLNPLLIKHKVLLIPEVQEQVRDKATSSRGTTMMYTSIKVRYRFLAIEDMSYVDVLVYGEGSDISDKASNKAMSNAFKYACFQVFCIPTEEMKETSGRMIDSERDSDELVDGEMARKLSEPCPPEHQAALVAEAKRIGVPIDKILGMYDVKNVSELTFGQFMDANDKLNKQEKILERQRKKEAQGKTA